MKTHQFIIITVLILVRVSIGYAQPDNNETIRNLNQTIGLLNDQVKSLEGNNQMYRDSIVKQNTRVTSLNNKIDTLTTEKEVFDKILQTLKINNQMYQDSIVKQNIRVTSLNNKIDTLTKTKAETIDNLNEQILKLNDKVDKLSNSKTRAELNNLKHENKKLTSENEKKDKEIERLLKVKNDYELLNTEKKELDKTLETKETNITRLTNEKNSLNAQVQQQKEALAAFKELQAEAMKAIKNEIPPFVSSKEFYNSDGKLAEYEKQIAMIKSVDKNNGDLNQLELDLQNFKKTIQIFKEAKSILEKPYDNASVIAAINKLENYTNRTNPYFEIEKSKLLKLLKNYCRAYKDALRLFNGLEVYDGKEDGLQKRNVENDIDFLRDYEIRDITITNKKSYFKIYDNYPYIKQILDIRYANPTVDTNPNNSLPKVNSNCN